MECGLERYEKEFGTDPRFTFMRLEGKDHGDLFTPEVAAACLDMFDSVCK